jgi:plasmid stabilization system protein ParE
MRVRFTRTAQRDLVRIHAYISEDSPDAAQQLVTCLIQRARGLADNPFEGRETDEQGARVDPPGPPNLMSRAEKARPQSAICNL